MLVGQSPLTEHNDMQSICLKGGAGIYTLPVVFNIISLSEEPIEC